VLLTLAALLLLLVGPAISLAGGYHVFGTDKVGQDVLYLTLKSIRTGLVIGTITTWPCCPLRWRWASPPATLAAGWTTSSSTSTRR
jgi:hypothetical protein